MQVSLSVANGSLTLASLAGLAFSLGDGTADPSVTFTGTLADINSALDGLSFMPTSGFSSGATLQVITSDQGNSGAGGLLTDTDTVNITIGAVNDAPTNNVPGRRPHPKTRRFCFQVATAIRSALPTLTRPAARFESL